MTPTVTPESEYLRRLARRVADAYLAHTKPRAILLTGSSAVGDADRYSDLDLILYYDMLPSEKSAEAARELLGATDYKLLAAEARREFAEGYQVEVVECQVGHVTIPAWEEDMASVLRGLDVASPIQKALGGLLEGIALHGDELIQKWQAEAADYPEPLRRAMVEHYLRFFPIWAVADRLASRDATIWIYQVLVESAQRILGVLAGLNRLYYSTFQFKRTHDFVARMTLVPANLADRLDALFHAETSAAIQALEQLTVETVDLVRTHMSEVDTTGQPPLVSKRTAMWTPLAPEGSAGDTHAAATEPAGPTLDGGGRRDASGDASGGASAGASAGDEMGGASGGDA